MKKNELSYKQLKDYCNPNIFKFDDTSTLSSIDTGIGQERGIKALEFGLSVDVKGYNLYLEGPDGVGKTMYTKNYLAKISKKKKTPSDWCYIYNFDNPNEPIALSLNAGVGKEFKDDMEQFIKDVKADINKTFSTEEFEKEKTLIKQEFEQKRSSLLEKLNNESMKYGFQVKTAQNGIYMMPVIDGKTIEEDEFEKLDENIKKEFEDKSSIVQEQIISAISEIKAIEKASDKKIEEWQSNVALLTINVHINYIKSKYKRNKIINKFLDNVKKDVLKNVQLFIEQPATTNTNQAQPVPRQEPKKPWLNYRVNLFIDNSNQDGAPVIMDSNYSYHGALKTDYTMLQPGLLHKANGGYIILQAKDLLSNTLCYEALKKALRIKELNIENAVDQRNSMVMVSLKPEPIPLDLKVILIGSSNIYHTLLSMDSDFRKLFKVKVEFEDDAPKTDDNMMKLARFIHGFCEQEELLPLDKTAVAKVIEYASKLANDKRKLSTKFNDLSEIVAEACTWAKLSKEKVVTSLHVQKALEERIDRIKKYDSKYTEMIRDNTLLISTSGLKVGQINGLTVMTIGDYSFGKPSKITVNTYTGKAGIIASSTELYALLSSLSNVPINQSIAVTGSVNQKGEIQPIGGVNEKIEGFYQICKMRSLDGSHGVMIPVQNIENLSLSDEIVDAVKKGNFHIYAVSSIEEGIEILTGVPAGKKDKYGRFPAGTVNALVYDKLKKYAEVSSKK